MNKCSIIPQILEDGRLVDSKLFTDLLAYTNNNRDFAKRLYIFSKEISTIEPSIEEVLSRYNNLNVKYNRVDFSNNFNNRSAKQVLTFLSNNIEDSFLLSVTNKLLENVDKLPTTKVRLSTMLDDLQVAIFDSPNNLITLNSRLIPTLNKRVWDESILHELVHSYTVSALSDPKTEAEIKFASDINKVYNSLKGSTIENIYGFTNQYEFVAEVLTNSDFIAELNSKKPTLIKKIVDAIKSLLGLNTDNISNIQNRILNFIDNSTPTSVGDAKTLEKRREGVVAEINSYASQRIESEGNIKPKERFLLQVHKKIKFKIGKLNNKIADINKEIKKLDLENKKEVRKIIDDYTAFNNGVYDTGYQNSPLYKTAMSTFENAKNVLETQITDLNTSKTELAKLLADLDITADITVKEAEYINLALTELNEIESRLGNYDLSTKEGQTQLAEDYLFTRLVNKTPDIISLQETASNLSTELLKNISTYISTISDAYLNTSGLGINVNIDVESILKTEDDITILGKTFEGFGDYPRLEAQLIHNITMDGKEKARLASLTTGQKILDHMKALQQWAKDNKKTNLIGKGSIKKAYSMLVEVNHLNRLDLVKPYSKRYYLDVNENFKKAYGNKSTDAEKAKAKKWIVDNYYNKPDSTYNNPKHTYIQTQPALKDFYDFFKETMKDNYSKLPEYINLKNEEKIPTMIRNSFWEFFSMRKENIFKSTLLALKTILIGQGRAEFYNEQGDPRSKFELLELSQDEIKLRMIGEVRADIKSFDLGQVLFEFTSFVNDYSEMMEVLPKVRMIQNIVETKEYVSSKKNGIFGVKKETISGGQSRMYDAINLYINGKIKGEQESPKWKLSGSDLYDNEGNVVGRTSYYLSDMIRSLIKYTRVLQLGFNPFSGINNVLAGLMGDMIEASGGKYFSKTDLLKAISIYTSNSLSKDRNVFTSDKNTTKLNLLSEYLQPLEEIGEWQDKREISLGSPTLLGAGIEKITSNAFIFQEAGEDFVQKITMIAYLLNKKTPEGKSYWSMIDTNGDKLVFKPENNFNTEEEVLATRKTILTINHNIHGNYSKDNSSVYDGALIFDAALVFKKWIPYMIRNRFMAKRYNYSTGLNDEGFYLAGSRGIAKSINNMMSYFDRKVNQSRSAIFSNKPLSKEEIIGIKRVIAEMIMLITFATISKILMPPPDDEDDKFFVPNWWEHLDISMWDSERQFDNQEGVTAIFIKSLIDSSKRLSSEAMQMYDPKFYADTYRRWALWSTLTEGWDVIRESFRFLTGEDRFDNKDLRYKSGPNKGRLRVEKEITDVIPYYKQIDRAKQNGAKTIEELQK